MQEKKGLILENDECMYIYIYEYIYIGFYTWFPLHIPFLLAVICQKKKKHNEGIIAANSLDLRANPN